MDTQFFNFHTHHPTLSPASVEIESVYFGQAKAPTSPCFSVGLHPWHLQNFDLNSAENWLCELAARPEVVAVGEAGLDKVTTTPWELQVAAFQLCFNIATAFQKPLIIHCVRAFGEILAFKKKWKHSPGGRMEASPWIFHGFEKNADTAEMLLNAGCYLSFGAALFRGNSHVLEALRHTPGERFFLETDDKVLGIEQVYEKAAVVRGVSIPDLAAQVRKNFESVFGVNSTIFAAKKQ